MIDPILELAQRDDALREAIEIQNDFCLEHLWYPQEQEFTDLGLYCLFNNK